MTRLLAVVLLVGVAVVADWNVSERASARGPSSAAVVEAYLRAHLSEDSERICRLSSLRGPRSQQRCRSGLQSVFADEEVRRERWRSVELRSVGAPRGKRLVSVAVGLDTVRASGTRVRVSDVWWLERRDGRLRILRAGSFDSEFFGYGPNPSAKERPISPAQAGRPADLGPALECGPALGSRRLKAASVVSTVNLRPIHAPPLDIIRAEIAVGSGGAPCLRLFTAAPLRPATDVFVSVDQRDGETRSVSASAQVRIGADTLRLVTEPETTAGPAGRSQRTLALRLPAHLSFNKRFSVAVSALSTQPFEPLIEKPVLAIERLETVEVSARRSRGAPLAPRRGLSH